MIDFVVFLSRQFFGLFDWLDSLVLFANVSLLKVLIISLLFTIALKFLIIGGDKK